MRKPKTCQPRLSSPSVQAALRRKILAHGLSRGLAGPDKTQPALAGDRTLALPISSLLQTGIIEEELVQSDPKEIFAQSLCCELSNVSACPQLFICRDGSPEVIFHRRSHPPGRTINAFVRHPPTFVLSSFGLKQKCRMRSSDPQHSCPALPGRSNLPPCNFSNIPLFSPCPQFPDRL